MANNKKSKDDNVVEKAKVEAQQRVADLTSGILPPVQQPVKKEPVVNNLSMEDEKNIEYLKEQLDLLTERNAVLETENETVKDDYQKLYQRYKDVVEGGNVSELGSNELEKKIIDLYIDIYDTYTGNKYGQQYEQIQIKAFLPKLANIFPFVRNYR